MTKEQVPQMIRYMNLPFAYDHFAEGESPDPPFLVYLYPGSDNFAADGTVYYKQDQLHIELYTDKKDPALEDRVEATINAHGLFYNKSETWIPSENLYEVLYRMEV
ncbi:MAG: hypothetical protein K6G33_12830 [Ruminococcus sp.]|uniref:hypothetical protein n=1 Tax=Ruminococcus sp. TaxID=41978 RepID=UPI0025F64129|nr:hypothetical protein [Ruminococcus sp.]MCR5601614.1 hypothetical protein [Ruminococcus sp.]